MATIWPTKLESETERAKPLMIIPIERSQTQPERKREREKERERERQHSTESVCLAVCERDAQLCAANEQVITPVLIRFTERAAHVRARQLLCSAASSAAGSRAAQSRAEQRGYKNPEPQTNSAKSQIGTQASESRVVNGVERETKRERKKERERAYGLSHSPCTLGYLLYMCRVLGI